MADPKPRRNEPMPFSMRLKPELRQALAREAEQQCRSLSSLVEMILNVHVDARLYEEQQEWSAFWETIHAETRSRRLDRMTPQDVLSEIEEHRGTRGFPKPQRG